MALRSDEYSRIGTQSDVGGVAFAGEQKRQGKSYAGTWNLIVLARLGRSYHAAKDRAGCGAVALPYRECRGPVVFPCASTRRTGRVESARSPGSHRLGLFVCTLLWHQNPYGSARRSAAGGRWVSRWIELSVWAVVASRHGGHRLGATSISTPCVERLYVLLSLGLSGP